MSATRALLFALWAVAGGVPLLWWLTTRRRVDPWTSMPLPAAVVGTDGVPLDTTGPATERSLVLDGALPAPGRTARLSARDGHPLAVTGVSGGRALVVALPEDPVRERRDQLLADLGARLAHDLNTPMAAVLGHLDLILHDLEGAAGDAHEVSRASARLCVREVTRAHQLSNDLLTFTRLRASASRRATEPVGALAEEAAAALLPLADELGVSLRVDVPSTRVLVEASPDDLVRALRNLLTNALRHQQPDPADGSAARPAVRLVVDSDEGSVTIQVLQTGPGLTPARLVDLREPLVRGTTERTGTGLGLAIVDEVLAAHGATLEVVPDPPPGWSGLGFTLSRHLP